VAAAGRGSPSAIQTLGSLCDCRFTKRYSVSDQSTTSSAWLSRIDRGVCCHHADTGCASGRRGRKARRLEATGPSAEKLRPLLERFTETRRSLAESAATPPKTSPADALADMLTADGFTVERLPAGDHQINIQIDLKTGKVVGTHATMHALADSDDSIGRKVFEAIAGGLSKFANELTDEIDKRLAENDVDGAVAAIKRGLDQGLFGLPLNERLLDALTRIDISDLSAPDRRHVRDGRLITAQQVRRFDVAGLEADYILAEDTGTLNPGQIATLKMTAALGALRRGNRETALTTLRSLLREPSDLNAEGRGWAWRNISNVLPDNDPEARRGAIAESW
jgi:hypothetical protein